MKKVMILAAGVLACSTFAQAQISLAPEVGINLANEHSKQTIVGKEYKGDGGIKLGVKAGANVNIPLGTRIVLQPGLFYAIKGYKDTKDQPAPNVKINRTLHYAEIPLNVQYMFNDPDEGRFFIGLGGYAAIAFSGHDKFNVAGKDMTKDLKFGNDAPSNDLRRFDFGAQANAGYLLKSGLFFRAMYQAGISNMLPQGNRTTGDASLRSTTITASIGYMIGGGPGKKAKNPGGMNQ